MSQFVAEINIPSCVVSVDLVSRLEKYLNSICLSDVMKSDDLKCKMNISIRDNFGTEHLLSMDDYSLSKFSDNTNRVCVKFSASNRFATILSVDIDFDKSKLHSTVKVSFEGDNPREFASGVSGKILSFISTCKNTNYIFHLSPFVSGMLSGLAMLVPGVAIFSFHTHRLVYLASVVFVGLYFFWVLSSKIRPYVTFQSNKSESVDVVWKWLITAFGSYLIFTLSLPYLVKTFFGD